MNVFYIRWCRILFDGGFVPRRIVFRLFAMLTAVVVALSCASVFAVINREVPNATPTIDGTITAAEMSSQLAVPMSWPFPNGFVAFNGAGDGVNDLSATWYLSWDNHHLNVSAVVLDNTPDFRLLAHGTGNAPYNGQDVIQPTFNPNNNPAHAFAPDPGGGPAGIYDMVVDTADGFGPDIYRHGATLSAEEHSSIAIAGQKTGTAGYILEAAIPWATAMDDVDPDYMPQVDDVHGMSFILLSFDGAGGGVPHGATLYTEFGNGANTIGSPTTWNTITLVGEPSPLSVWDNANGGDWNVAGNWQGGIPNSASAIVVFDSAIQTSRTVFTDEPVTVKTVQFDNTNAYAIAGAGSVNFAAETGMASITVGATPQGSHAFQAQVNLNSNIDVAIENDANLEFINRLNLNGNTLTKTGAGTLIISNLLNTGGGMLNIQEGTVSGSGTVGGDVNNEKGTLFPGNNLGVVTGNVTQVVVPEPNTLTLLALGGLFLVFTARRCCHTSCLRRHFAYWPVSVLIVLCWNLSSAPAQGISAKRIASGLSNPVYVTSPPGDTSRLFVVELRSGKVKILNLSSGTFNPAPFVTVTGMKTTQQHGLHAIAFHPDYATNGKFYVDYVGEDAGGTGTPNVTTTNIVEYQVSANPDIADPSTRRSILRFERGAHHVGSWMGFSPNDGFLYYTGGDGGCCGNDSGQGHTQGIGNAQDIEDNLMGKLLRIDVNSDSFPMDADRNYTVPNDNPFVGQTGDDEIWAYGLRNPFRASFDRDTGDLYIADNGEDTREEINYQSATSTGGENYGWRLREGSIATPTPIGSSVGGSRPANNVDPFYDYGHGPALDEGRSVAGGYVYRGPISALQGRYFFGDFVRQRIWSVRPSGNTFSEFTDWTSQLDPSDSDINSIVSFGEDGAGNLYIVDFSDGEVFSIVSEPAETSLFVWGHPNGGDWNVVNNWQTSVPNSNGAIAVFGSSIQTPRTVFTDEAVTVKGIHFDNTNTYVIAGTGSVNFAAGTGMASITVGATSGRHAFQTQVNLNSDVDVAIENGASLEFVNQLNLNGNTLAKTGGGMLTISNTLNNGGGTVNLQGGSVSGVGTVGGDVINDGGRVSPGNSSGNREDSDGFVPVVADTINIGSLGSDFEESRRADWAHRLTWNDSTLVSDEAVFNVPEPNALMLLMLGGLIYAYTTQRQCRR